MLAWRVGLDLKTLGLRSDHVGGVDRELHITYGGGIRAFEALGCEVFDPF